MNRDAVSLSLAGDPVAEEQEPLNQETVNEKSASEMNSPVGNGSFSSEVILKMDSVQTRTYKKRWAILILFVFHSMSNAFQWIQYSIITNIIVKYYDVSAEAVNWTSTIYMVTYMPLIFPAAYLLNKKGLRVCVLIGSFGTALGAWIKCGSISPDRFLVTMAGQTISAVSQIFILGIPPKLAAVWFGPKEVSTACAIGVFGNQLGVAFGFFVPPMLVPYSENLEEIGKGLTVMFFGVAIACTVIFILVIFIFRGAPTIPPSAAAAASAASAAEDVYYKSILRLMRNRNYILLLLSYGINVGVFYAISIHLNTVFVSYFGTGQEQTAGRIGLTIVISGMVGSLICGFWLDKTHSFKGTTLAVYVFSFLGMIAYTFNFQLLQVWVVYLIAASLGFFMTGYLPLGFEFAAEITYPESEGTSSGLLNAAAQFFGVLFTNIAEKLLDRYGDITSNLSLCGALLVGAIMTALIKADLRRQRAQNQEAPKTPKPEIP